jgi:trans-aconitate 2-methyltransferase
MSDWDATRYHRISAPQFDWGQRVIARLKPQAGERILDLGCGTGRLTEDIRAAVNGGQVVGLDRSGSMLSVARATPVEDTGRPVAYVQASGDAIPFHNAFGAVFSAATLHWIHDHDAVFASVFDALAPGGRFVAQCGGEGNLHRLLQHAAALMSLPEYQPYFRGWRDPWNFADAPTTARRLERAGFDDVETWLEEAPANLGTADAYAEFISVVCIRHHLERLPLDRRDPFVRTITARAAGDEHPLVLDYRRLNISARKAAR